MSSSVVYECTRCGATMTDEDLEMRGGAVKCVSCSYKILKKLRPPVVSRRKAL